VQRNLALLDEDRIDYDLLEALVAHINEANAEQEGSILVFLPGGREGGRGKQMRLSCRPGALVLAAVPVVLGFRSGQPAIRKWLCALQAWARFLSYTAG
jgi:hypothetical protein